MVSDGEKRKRQVRGGAVLAIATNLSSFGPPAAANQRNTAAALATVLCVSLCVVPNHVLTCVTICAQAEVLARNRLKRKKGCPPTGYIEQAAGRKAFRNKHGVAMVKKADLLGERTEAHVLVAIVGKHGQGELEVKKR